MSEEDGNEKVSSSLTYETIPLDNCKTRVVYYSNTVDRLYASCEIDQHNRILVYELAWNNGQFEQVDDPRYLFYAGPPDDPVRPVILDPFGESSTDMKMVTANRDFLFYYNLATSHRIPSGLPMGCTRVLHNNEVLVNSERKLIFLCSDNKTESLAVTTVHIIDLVILDNRQQYTLPSPVPNTGDVIIRFSAEGRMVVMATGSQVIAMDGTSSNSLRTKQFSAIVQEVLLLSDSECAIVVGGDFCRFSLDLLFNGQNPPCVSISTSVCAPPTCPRLQLHDGQVYAVRDVSGSYNITVFNSTTFNQVTTNKLRIVPKWLIFTPATIKELIVPTNSTPAQSGTVAITDPSSPAPSPSLIPPPSSGPQVVNLDVVMIATISVGVVMAAIVLVAVIVLVGLIVRFIYHRKPRLRDEQNIQERYENDYEMLPQNSAPSSVDSTPVLKHATSNLLGSTTVTPVPSRHPSPPPSVTPDSGTNVSTSLPLTTSAPAVQPGPPQPSSLPECTTEAQQDTRPHPARGPNTVQTRNEMVFPDQSRPSPATADSASPVRPTLQLINNTSLFSATSPSKSANGNSPPSAATDGASLSRPTMPLSSPFTAKSPSSAANGYSPSKPLPATNNGGPYKQETDRNFSSLDNP